MEDKKTIFEPLFERAESLGKTSYELFKLKTIDKSVGVISTYISRRIAVFVLSLFIVFVSIGASLWLGDLLGKTYYGFFCVGGFYGIVACIIYFFMHNWIKKCVGNSIIKQMFN